MPVPLRRFYAQQLIKAKETEKKTYEEINKNKRFKKS
jgi:hypothetical protein|tara:strand:- start:425 stop:535 length:111 start_codon:yes stop_codon:yes gene_type:complete